jgi:hypothetical protein
MPNDLILAVLALLFLWLLARLHEAGRKSVGEGAGGREAVKVPGLKDIHRINTLPPRPLAFGARVSVPGETDEGGPFQVDLGQLTCDCPDFTDRRAHLPPDAIGRVCPHLSQALRTTGATGSMDDLVQTIVESGPTVRSYFECPLPRERTVAIGHSPGEDLLEVFAAPRPVDLKEAGSPRTYRRYGYSLARERWLNDERPPGSGAIVEIIGRLPLVR